jgi:myo-inositol 2-dehydrogenase/D-chiro-inositol 1-dehydrogenase
LKPPLVAVIGAGMRGTGLIRSITAMQTGGRIVAYADPHGPSRENAAQAAPDAVGFADWRQMLSTVEAEVLLIAAPQHLHCDMTLAGLDADLDIYCEKPMAATLEDCDRIVSAVRRAKSLFYVGLQLRTVPVFKHVKQMVDDGTVGKPRMLFCRELRAPFLPKVDDWIADESKSGGTIVEKNVHHFDLFNWYCGSRAVRVHAIGGKALTAEQGSNAAELLDHAFVLIDYENGARACLEVCFFCPAWAHELEIIGENGRRLVTDLEQLKLWDAEQETRRHDIWSYPLPQAHGDDTGWLDFLDARQSGSPSESVSRAEAGRSSVQIALAAQQSIEICAEVRLDGKEKPSP